MPTYDYQCRTCGHRFEYFQSMTSDVLTHCPVEQCGGTEDQRGKGEVTRRVGAGAGLVFKGEGFYLTDYVRKSGEGETKSAPTKSTSDAAGKGDASASGSGSGQSESSAGSVKAAEKGGSDGGSASKGAAGGSGGKSSGDSSPA